VGGYTVIAGEHPRQPAPQLVRLPLVEIEASDKSERRRRPSASDSAKHERQAPTVGETQLLLQTIRNEGGYPTNLIARLHYGCGLRVTEPLNLRIKDLNLERRSLCIRGAKGGDDRVVPLPASLLPELTQQMQHAQSVWQRDKQDRTPLMLPHRLARKYPEYRFSWGWACLFPAHYTCRESLHHKRLNRRILSALHGSLAGPAPGLRRGCAVSAPGRYAHPKPH